MGCHPSHWRTHIFQDGFLTTNQIWIKTGHCSGGFSSLNACQPRRRKVRETITSSMKHVTVSGPSYRKNPVGPGSIVAIWRFENRRHSAIHWVWPRKNRRISVDLIWKHRITIATTRIKPSLFSTNKKSPAMCFFSFPAPSVQKVSSYSIGTQ